MTTAPAVALAAHPLCDAAVFETTFPKRLGDLPSPPSLVGRFVPGATAPVASSDHVRAAVRDLLRHGGFKPTGRSKPASEYLLRASQEGSLSSINAAVDACNVVSLHSGLPISVVDLDRTAGALSIAIAPAGATYVFNASGQSIDVGGLLCLLDEEGPCANAVKDAQRTKTSADTTRTLSVVWGTNALPGATHAACSWYVELLRELGATTHDIAPAP